MYIINRYGRELGYHQLEHARRYGFVQTHVEDTDQNNKLGVAEKSRVRKVLMEDYGLSEAFFKEIDSSVKKNCKNQNDIKTYFFMFQGFCNDLFNLLGNLMQWKFRMRRSLKRLCMA